MEKYGFVYIWYDKKHKRYYIGSHWGSENDGYICSSRWMRKAYRRRPNDFKRRIIARVYESKNALLDKEHEWMLLIKDEELGDKYYNYRKHRFGHWSSDEELSKNVRQRMSEKMKGVPIHSDEYKERLRQQALGNNGNLGGGSHPKLGTKHSDETRKKISKANKGRKITWENGMAKDWIVTSEDGISYKVKSLRSFCTEHNINTTGYKNLSHRGKAQGWKAERV